MEVHRFSFSSPVLNREEFSLSFNTNSSSGLLLWVGGDTSAGSDFMALGVNRGRVELRCVPHMVCTNSSMYIGGELPETFFLSYHF